MSELGRDTEPYDDGRTVAQKHLSPQRNGDRLATGLAHGVTRPVANRSMSP